MIGDVFVRPAWRNPESQPELFRILLDTLIATPGIRRVVGMYRIGSWDPGDRWLRADGAEVTPRASLRA